MKLDQQSRIRAKAKAMRANQEILTTSPYKAAIENTMERLREAPFYSWAEILHQFAAHASSLAEGRVTRGEYKFPPEDCL